MNNWLWYDHTLLTYIVWSSEFMLPQRSITIHVCRQGIIACNNNNMRNPTKWTIHVCRQGIIACNNNNMRNPSFPLWRWGLGTRLCKSGLGHVLSPIYWNSRSSLLLAHDLQLYSLQDNMRTVFSLLCNIIFTREHPPFAIITKVGWQYLTCVYECILQTSLQIYVEGDSQGKVQYYFYFGKQQGMENG